MTVVHERSLVCLEKVHESVPNLSSRGAFLTLKAKIYRSSSETRDIKVEDMERLERAERMMMKHVCGVSLKDTKSTEQMKQRLDIDFVTRRNRFSHVLQRT